jgi:CRP/FNR family transcriptional regulator, cyclic AMP receptor protein
MKDTTAKEATVSNRRHNSQSWSPSPAYLSHESFRSLVPMQVYPARIELCKQGCDAHDVYYVERGLIKISCIGSGGRQLIIGLRPPRCVFGAESLILKKPSLITASTLTGCHLYRIPGDIFLTYLRNSPHLSWNMFEIQSREIYEQNSRLAQLGCCSAQERLEVFLLQLIAALGLDASGEEIHEDIHIELPFKYCELAELIAVTPEYLSLLIKKMEREGLLRHDKHYLIIPDSRRIKGGSDGWMG